MMTVVSNKPFESVRPCKRTKSIVVKFIVISFEIIMIPKRKQTTIMDSMPPKEHQTLRRGFRAEGVAEETQELDSSSLDSGGLYDVNPNRETNHGPAANTGEPERDLVSVEPGASRDFISVEPGASHQVEEKNHDRKSVLSRNKLSALLCILLFAACAGLGYAIWNSQERFDEMQKRFDKLQNENEELKMVQARFDEMMNENEALKLVQARYDDLQSENEELKLRQASFDEVKKENEALKLVQAQFDDLQSKNEELKRLQARFDEMEKENERQKTENESLKTENETLKTKDESHEIPKSNNGSESLEEMQAMLDESQKENSNHRAVDILNELFLGNHFAVDILSEKLPIVLESCDIKMLKRICETEYIDLGKAGTSKEGRKKFPALHQCVKEDYHEKAKVLLTYGANVNLDWNGCTPMSFAEDKLMKDFLKKWGADITLKQVGTALTHGLLDIAIRSYHQITSIPKSQKKKAMQQVIFEQKLFGNDETMAIARAFLRQIK